MKYCKKCDLEKPLAEFAKKGKGNQPYCIPCNRQYQRQHYINNKQDYLDKAKRWDLQQYDKVLSYLRQHPCVDCGESNIVCLDFDHSDRSTKELTVSFGITKGYSWDRLRIEIEKCVVRCKNCHAKITAAQFGWRKALEILP
jgi:hypothetical protein